VSESTINLWKLEHEGFSESISNGKVKADADVAESLYKRAKGYTIDTVKVFQYQGEPVIVPVQEEIAAEVAAARMWLNNRRPKDWKERQEVTLTDKRVLFEGEEKIPD
jgi:hypothetical protein